MITPLHRRDSQAFTFDHILLVRPEPAHAELFLDERIYRVRRPVFLLDTRLHRQPTLGLHVRWVPTVATCDDEMLLVRHDERLLCVFEIEDHLRKQGLHRRLHADPYGALR